MIKIIYLITIFVLVIISIYIFVQKYEVHQDQLLKINRLEEIHKEEHQIIKHNRSITEPCQTPNLTNPRDCYFGSNYKCSWNELAKRCNEL